jgi:molybdate transport system substrate-binding protein
VSWADANDRRNESIVKQVWQKDWFAFARRWIAGCLLVLSGTGTLEAQGHGIRVAAASDLQFAMTELTRAFEKHTGIKVDPTYGSSGNFFSQIRNGAPFDLFFSADIDFPKRLAEAGVADQTTLCRYAVGRIAIWMPPDAAVDVSRETWKALLDEHIQRIAIANPEHAPYGHAALSALQKAGIYDQVKGKLVYGENISQAAQFVQSGNAQAGIIALSLVLSPAMRNGQAWIIPSNMHAALEQAAIVLTGAKNRLEAVNFLRFVAGPEGRSILERFGFQVPGRSEETAKPSVRQ